MDDRPATGTTTPTTTPLSYSTLPAQPLAPDDRHWRRSLRNGAALVFLAGALSLWWPGHPFGFDVESPSLGFVLNSLPLVVPILLGWSGTWALLRPRPGRPPYAAPGRVWRWGMRLGVTTFAFLPFVVPAFEALSIDPGATSADVEPLVAKAAPVLTGLLWIHVAVLAWATGSRFLAANASVLAAGMPLVLGALLRMNAWSLQFQGTVPPFHPVIGVGYPVILPVSIGLIADRGLRWSWKNNVILGVGVGALWALIVFLCLAKHFAGVAREAKRPEAGGAHREGEVPPEPRTV